LASAPSDTIIARPHQPVPQETPLKEAFARCETGTSRPLKYSLVFFGETEYFTFKDFSPSFHVSMPCDGSL
jgi:hypothetical protein